MGTKFASYTLKLASLHEYYQRLLYLTPPVPSGSDMAITLKYFSQSLLSLLKDLENSPYELLKFQNSDSERMALYPNLDYKQLYNAVSQMIDVIPSVHSGLNVFGQSLLQCLTCLLPFLEHDLIENLPYLVASSIAVLPKELHQDIINYLCFYILPFTMNRKLHDESENYASQSISAVLMMILEYSKNPAQHCQLLECLMALKSEIVRDLLCVIAYGTVCARASATKLLFYYWPAFNPNLLDKKSVLMKFSNDFLPFGCQRDDCPNSGSAEATKVCYSHSISILYASDLPPPLYLCIECANEIHKDNPNQIFNDILHPTQQISLVCENKNCRALEKAAVSVCFNAECASYNGNHPIRYCQQCHNIRHNNRRGNDHVFHVALSHISQMDSQMQTHLVQAVISLLREAESNPVMKTADLHIFLNARENTPVGPGIESENRFTNSETNTLEECQLLGRYGIWLLVGLCSPDQDVPIEILGRILSMLFHWFHITAYSFDDTDKRLMHLIFSVGQAENTLEKLKTDYVCKWLFEIMNKYHDIFISCLLPYPANYVQVGGLWETLAPQTSHLKDGLNRLFCLIPYEIITPEIWNHVMPYWMEAIANDILPIELQNLRTILSKILDPEMSPLGFDTQKLYNFVSDRFINTNPKIQEQAINWLQSLTMLGITIPISHLLLMFKNSVSGEQHVTSESNGDVQKEFDQDSLINSGQTDDKNTENQKYLSDEDIPLLKGLGWTTNNEMNLSCSILMLDVLLKQMELQNIDKHCGVNSWICQEVCSLLKSIEPGYWNQNHDCERSHECFFCEAIIIWHQLCLQVLIYLTPEKLAYPPDDIIEESAEELEHGNSFEIAKKQDNKPDVVMNMPIPEIHSVGGVLVHMPHFFEQIMTATVETVSEQLDLATIIPAEKITPTVARPLTISDTDVATAKIDIAQSKIAGKNGEVVSKTEENVDNFWSTSKGRFRYSVDDLPPQLQYIYKLFRDLASIQDSNILTYMLESLKMMCLHGDILNIAIKEHQGFFIWCQENVFIKTLWELLNAEHSHVAQTAVPLLLHCVTLPQGIDTFWLIVQEDFHNLDWRVRFTSVERVALIGRFINSTPIKNCTSLQMSLAHSFCYLINSMDDINAYVAQKATLCLCSIHDTAMKALLMCMETQFDLAIIDRPLILQCLYQLHNCLGDRKIMNWDFFFNRFDTLFLEAQVSIDKMEGLNYFRDLRNSDLGSEALMKKLHRAQETLSNYDNNDNFPMKTIVSSFGAEWSSKRTILNSTSKVSIQENSKKDSDIEKFYNRQYSAPILKRKASRFGLGQLIGYTLPNNSIADVHLPSLSVADDATLSSFMHKIIDFEEADGETIHLLIFLFMQFLSRQDQAYPCDEKKTSIVQGIVIRHFYLLLGYNQTEKNFYMTPQKVRSSVIFTSFITNLPQVLDQNNKMGLYLIQPFLIILQNVPCPYARMNVNNNYFPIYSLWCMKSTYRRAWLLSVLIILYKFEYNQQKWFDHLQVLIRMVLHTLETHYHVCNHLPSPMYMSSLSSHYRDHLQSRYGLELTKVLSVHNFEPCSNQIENISSSNNLNFFEKEKQKSNVEVEKFVRSVIENSSPNVDMKKSDNVEIMKKMKLTLISEKRCRMNPKNEKVELHHIDGSQNIAKVKKESNLKLYDRTNAMDMPIIERLLPIGTHPRYTAHWNGEGSDTSSISFKNDSLEVSELKLPLPERLLPVGPYKNASTIIADVSCVESISTEDFKLKDYTTNERFQEKVGAKKLSSVKAIEIEKDSLRKLTRKSVLDFSTVARDNQHDSSSKSTECQSIKKQFLSEEKNIKEQKTIEHFANGRDMRHGVHAIFGKESLNNISNHTELRSRPKIIQLNDEYIFLRCSECGLSKEEYSDEEIGLFIIVLGTFIHREPCLAVPLLPEILNIITKVTSNTTYPWQCEITTHLPGGALSVARQFTRCILHQMAPNGIFTQIFQTNVKGTISHRFFKSVAQALIDFNELNPIAPLQILLENLVAKKNLPIENLATILDNISSYLECLPLEAGLGSGASTWNGLLIQFEGFFRKVILVLPALNNLTSLLKIMISILKVPGMQPPKGILEPFSKVLSYVIQNSVVHFTSLTELCFLCYRNFTKDRDKHFLSRVIVYELNLAMKFKTMVPDSNFLLLLQFILDDCGGLLTPMVDSDNSVVHVPLLYNTNSAESLKVQINDVIDFLIDVHSSGKVKSYTFGLQDGFNGDTLCGLLKCGLAQFLALEITKGNHRENRAVTRYLPWLYSTPSTVIQGSREYTECVNHIRLLSWLLLGSLAHSLAIAENKVTQSNGSPIPASQPIPQEASCYIADHIQLIFSAFPDHYKSSVINMASIFYAFNLCQLWTLYLEECSKKCNPSSELHNVTMNILLEFWGKITPCILQLVLHSKMFADIVNLHFSNLLETFLDCGCLIFNKLLPVWNLILSSPNIQLHGYLFTRLQNHQKTLLIIGEEKKNVPENKSFYLSQWLRRLQFKMGQIEMQSSNTTPFYSF